MLHSTNTAFNYIVNIPLNVSLFFKKQNHMRKGGSCYVKAIINDDDNNSKLYPLTLCPSKKYKKSKHKMYLNNSIRSKLKLKANDEIRFELWHDPQSRIIETPQSLLDAMKNEKNYDTIYKNWMSLSPSKRKEKLAYLTSLKTDKSRNKCIQKIISQLKEAK